MKKLISMFFASLFMAASAAHAQSAGVEANVPFDFVIGDSTLRAGTYTIRPISAGDGPILLRSADLTDAVVMNPCPCASDWRQHESELVFRVIGDRYFLWQIWTAGYRGGRELSINPWQIQEADAGPIRTVVIKAAFANPSVDAEELDPPKSNWHMSAIPGPYGMRSVKG